MSIKIEDERDEYVPGFLHCSPYASVTLASNTAAILLSGAGDDIVGPFSTYLSLAEKIASLKQPVPALYLDYRYPARRRCRVRDLLAAVDELESGYGIRNFGLVDWWFGGTPVFCMGGSDKRVVGCATIASQTAETEGVRNLAPKPLLLLHGTGDRTLIMGCTDSLYEHYGEDGDRYLHLFPGDDHAITRDSIKAAQLVGGYVLKCAGIKPEKGDDSVLADKLVQGGEKVELMKRGGYLRGNESVE